MLGWLLLTQIMVDFVGRSLALLSPLIENDLHLSKVQVGMLMSALFLGQSLISLPSGYWVDRVGSRFLLFDIMFEYRICHSRSTKFFFVVIVVYRDRWSRLRCNASYLQS
ncbi:MFS transporter [Geobacillus sp. Y412MC52]|uniref:MFS transporter n=1 Tax=Geobacillus sp. (strain Y412MC52) TaxID=550542 RepID=UPI0011854E1F